MSKARWILPLSMAVGAAGCASTVKLTTSPPGVEVKDGDQSLGKTPLELTLGDVSNQQGGGALVTLRNPGYRPVSVWIPGGLDNADVNVNMIPFRIANEEAPSATIEEEPVKAPPQISQKDAKDFLKYHHQLLFAQDYEAQAVRNFIDARPDIAAARYLAALLALRNGEQGRAQDEINTAVRLAPGEVDYQILAAEISQGSAP